ncbi:MAG: hypothetical protein HPY75_08165 [Actinobacteria bacterium]|nr:hypothetical protein [Actinomycetota bacterium]
MKKWWRSIHRLNYVVFAVALVHAFQVGTDLRDGGFLAILLYLYAALAAAGLIYRVQFEARARLARRAGGKARGPGAE